MVGILTDKQNNIKDELATLIKDTSIEKLELLLFKPNIFDILKIKDVEVRHSNFLAWLLDPEGNHNLRDIFLKWFLKEVFASVKVAWANEFMVDSMDTRDIKIMREFTRIDLVLVSTEFVLVIENKMWSADHTDQLNRYKQTINKIFPKHKKAFVFLTPYGAEPKLPDDAGVYVSYAYASIVKILEYLVELHYASMSQAVRTYIEDYLCILRRNIMKEDDVIELAQKIYEQHKNAFDFIFEHKPDRMLEASESFLAAIKKAGYIPETQNKGFARFLTKELHEVIPRTGLGGWKNNEQFLFEINFWSKNMTLKTVVGPGNKKNREIIINALMTINGAMRPKTEIWSSIHSHKHQININNEKYQDPKKLQDDLFTMLKNEAGFIEKVSNVLVALKKDYEYSP